MLSHLSYSQHLHAHLRAEPAHYNIRDAAGQPYGPSAHMRADLGLDIAHEPARDVKKLRLWRGWRIGLRWPVYVKRVAN